MGYWPQKMVGSGRDSVLKLQAPREVPDLNLLIVEHCCWKESHQKRPPSIGWYLPGSKDDQKHIVEFLRTKDKGGILKSQTWNGSDSNAVERLKRG